MECLFNEDYKWNDRANDTMSLSMMLDVDLSYYIFIDNLLSDEPLRYKPHNEKNCKSGLFGLNAIYHDYNELIIDIVEVFFHNLLFIPSKIRNPESEEYFLFMTLYAIQNIVWYQNIENSKERGYDKTKKEAMEAIKVLKELGYSPSMENTVDFPDHKNETLKLLKGIFKKGNRMQQWKRVIGRIKEPFGIKRVTTTNKQQTIKFAEDFIKNSENILPLLENEKKKQEEEYEKRKRYFEAKERGQFSKVEEIKQQLRAESEPILNQIMREDYLKTTMIIRASLSEVLKRRLSKFEVLCRAYQPKK